MNEQISPSNVLPVRSDLLAPTMAAQFLNTTPSTLAVWRCTKRYPLKFVKVGRRIFYRLRDLEAFIELRTHSGVGDALTEPECKIGSAGVQDTTEPECKIEEQECKVTMHTTVTRPTLPEDRPLNRQKAQGDSGDTPTDPKTGSVGAASERFRKIPSREDQESQPIPSLCELLNIAVDEIYIRNSGWDDYYSLDDVDGPKSASAITGWIIERHRNRKAGNQVVHQRGYFRSAIRQFLQDNEITACSGKLDRFADGGATVFSTARRRRFCKLLRGSIAERRVRPRLVIVLLPMRDLLPGVGQITEPVLVQALVTKASVEALHIAVLHWSSWLYGVPLQALS